MMFIVVKIFNVICRNFKILNSVFCDEDLKKLLQRQGTFNSEIEWISAKSENHFEE